VKFKHIVNVFLDNINLMHIKEKYILEYQKLYFKKFKIKLSYQESLSQCIDMVKLGKAVYRKINHTNYKPHTCKLC